MHTAIRQYQVDPGSVDEITRGVNEGLLPLIKDVSGFQAYYALDAGGGRIASVSVFEDRAGAEESSRVAADWIRQNMASLFPNPPEVLARGSRRTRSSLSGSGKRNLGYGRRSHGPRKGGHGQVLRRRRREAALGKSGTKS
jgi:hypothetical protein